ncbi:MAG: glycosyltransferase [Bacteroidales bacterium]|nr:glycosyltransferase [Bacteroidales bacterium]
MSPIAHKPKVSIVMSFFDEPLQWIRLAIDSILAQTLQDFELLLICDNPEHDEAIRYVRNIADRRIRLTINAANIGPTKSFNIAIAQAQGEYIARMDADDICLAERLEKQVAYLERHPEVSVCATNTHSIDGKGKIIRRNRYDKKHDRALMFISNNIAHPTVMFRQSLLDIRKPLYNEEFIYSQDYELWQHLLLRGHLIHTLDEVLLLYRKTEEQISSAQKPLQTELFEKAQKSFISEWLSNHGIIRHEDREDIHMMLKKASCAYRSVPSKELTHIIYALYLSLGRHELKYRFKYLWDSNLIVFRVRFIFTLRLLCAKKRPSLHK